MCDPVSLTIAALGAGGQAYTAKKEKEEAQEQAEEVRREQVRQANIEAAVQDDLRTREERREQSRIAAEAGQNGVGGLSIAALRQEAAATASADRGAISGNRDNAVSSANLNYSASVANAEARANAGYVGAASGFGSAAGSALATRSRRRRSKGRGGK